MTVTTSCSAPPMLRQGSFDNLDSADAKIITAEPFRETLHCESDVEKATYASEFGALD